MSDGGIVQPAARGPAPPLSRLKALMSEYTGVVRNGYELLSAPDDARMFYYGCEISDTHELLGHGTTPRSGGAHYEREAALAAALGEALERYCGAFLPESHFVLGSAAELGPVAVDPTRFSLFRQDQYAQQSFPYRPFTRLTPVRWVQGFSVSNAKPALLPVQLVYLPESLAPGEIPIGYATSSGMACGLTLTAAILKGVLEVVERDAFMLAWSNRLVLPRVDFRADARLATEDLRHFAPTRLCYDVMDFSSFSKVPTAVAVVRGRPPDPVALALGAASAPTMYEACGKALREAFQTRHWIRQMRQQRAGRFTVDDIAELATFEDHVLFYSYHSNVQPVEFLTSSDSVRCIDQIPSLEGDTAAEWIEAILRRLMDWETTAYAVDITAPDVRQAGLCVVKVISPELCPLDVGYKTRFLGGRRLYEATCRVGMRDRALRPEELNADPHPFP